MDSEPATSSDNADVPVTRERALGAIKRASALGADESKRSDLAEAVAKAVEVDGRRRYFALRDRWSTAIVWWISILILFNIGITLAVGANWLSFANMQWFITAVLVQTFLQIVGLGVVAVKYLFSDKPSSSKN